MQRAAGRCEGSAASNLHNDQGALQLRVHTGKKLLAQNRAGWDNRDKKEKVQRKARAGSKAQKVRGHISRYHVMCLGGARPKREHCELAKLSWATKLTNLETT